ncbi:MAG TPA: hypothetical protein VLF79_03805 [Candidatus Saccharimonadales bacterium]|nr:hypothetical protein [Candidatus Saccharimonadales bacterium]
MPQKAKQHINIISKYRRNDALIDIWSLVHVSTGALMAWVMPPTIALLFLIGWEPLEVLILSPILSRYNIVFGRETLRNSLSDILCDVIGVALGIGILTNLVAPPFHFF